MNLFIIGHKSPDLDAMAATVEYAEFLTKAKLYENYQLTPLRAGDPNKETEHIFNKFNVDIPKPIEDFEITDKDIFVLMDHNEESQRHEKVVNDQVVEIVDHHKVNINFTSPVRLDVRPLGSTSTIVHEIFDKSGIEPSERIKGLILASILSDTQGLKASTTTGIDSVAAHRLARELEIDIEKFIFEIFKAKSDITGLSAEEIARKDFKIFDFAGKKVFINQVETVEPEIIVDMKEEIQKALEEIKSQEGVGQAYAVVTDILKVNSQIIYTTDEEKEIVEKAFTTQDNRGIADIGPRMSRKKDIAPEIEKVILNP